MKVEQENKSFVSRETSFQGKYGKSLFNTVYQAYRPFFVKTLLLLGAGFLGRIALLGNANLIGHWVDRLSLSTTDSQDSKFFLSTLIAATVLGFLFTLLFRTGISRLSAKAVSKIYDETTLRTSRLPMSFFDQNPAGRVMTRFSSDYNNIFRIFGGPLAEFLGLIFDLLAMMILIVVASPWFLPFWLIQAALNYLVYRYFLAEIRKQRREVALKRSPSITHFSESAMGGLTIRAFGKEDIFARRFSKLNDAYLEQRQSSMSLFVRFSIAMTVATAVTLLLMGLSSIWLISSGRVSVGAIGVALAYLGLSSNILQSFFEWLGQFEEAMTGLERMNEYLRMPLEPGARLPSEAQFFTGHPFETTHSVSQRAEVIGDGNVVGIGIEIQNLSMRYREDLPWVLRDVSLSIKPGERVAVVGKTGSGKTSFVQALFRLYPLATGKIRIGGFEADVEVGTGAGKMDLATYRSLIAYITQDATLFIGSLRENLCAFQNVEDDFLIAALRRVQFLKPHATDKEYQHWLEYKIEERGRNLSMGERQLVCMARCLIQDAPIVILDEATSSIDPQSEQIINLAAETFFKGKTQIIIAHRLSTLRQCNRVLWFQNGRVHRWGSTEQILEEFEKSDLSI